MGNPSRRVQSCRRRGGSGYFVAAHCTCVLQRQVYHSRLPRGLWTGQERMFIPYCDLYARSDIFYLQLWTKEIPEAVEEGRVDFQPHDFFSPQPVKDASVFILKQILHDWSDPYSSRILTELRKAARDDTKLLVVDNIVAPVCHDPTFEGRSSGVPGALIKDAPPPLLANFGAANEMNYTIDLAVSHINFVWLGCILNLTQQMMVWLNAQERTLGHMSKLLEKSGWRVIRCKRVDPPCSFYEPVIAEPIPGFTF